MSAFFDETIYDTIREARDAAQAEGRTEGTGERKDEGEKGDGVITRESSISITSAMPWSPPKNQNVDIEKNQSKEEMAEVSAATKVPTPKPQLSSGVEKAVRGASSKSTDDRAKEVFAAARGQNYVEREVVRDNVLDDKEFSERVALVGGREMFYPNLDDEMWVVNLSTLQRMNIHAIQKDLVHEVKKIRDLQIQTLIPPSNDSDGSDDSSDTDVD